MNAQYVRATDVILLLTLAMIDALRAAGVAWKVHNHLSVELAEDFEPMPDIVVWAPSAAPPDLDGPLPADAPRLIVEVADTTPGDDLGGKLEGYARAGVAEYWGADVRGRRILRHAQPEGSGYRRREPLASGAPAAWLTRPEIVAETTALR